MWHALTDMHDRYRHALHAAWEESGISMSEGELDPAQAEQRARIERQLAATMPVTTEMMTLVDQCRRKQQRSNRKQRPRTTPAADSSTSVSHSSSPPPSPSLIAATSVPSPTPSHPVQTDEKSSTSPICPPSSTTPSDSHSHRQSEPNRSQPSQSQTPSPSSKAKKKSKVAMKKDSSAAPSHKPADPDVALLDSVMAGDLSALGLGSGSSKESEADAERRRAKNRKKKAKAKLREKMGKEKQQDAQAEQHEGQVSVAGEQHASGDSAASSHTQTDGQRSEQRVDDTNAERREESEKVVDRHDEIQPADATDAQQQGKKKKKKKNKVPDQDGTIPPSTAVVDEASSSSVREPVDDIITVASPSDVASAPPSVSQSNSQSKQSHPIPKSQRVHRVEDEEGDEEWFVATKRGKVKHQPTAKTKGKANGKEQQQQTKQQQKSNAQSTVSPHTAVVSSTTPPSTTPTTVTGNASTSTSDNTLPPIHPSFPALLRSFHSHRSHQHQDAAELLHLLCESIQNEWTKARKLYPALDEQTRSAGDESEDDEETSVGADATGGEQQDDDAWNEVGRGSRAIRVSSRLSFQPTPLSRVFCGRLRSQLSTSGRSAESMSFQPFWMVGLEIEERDDEEEEEESRSMTQSSKQQQKKGSSPTQSNLRRRSKPTMSVERALDRFMCPSEVVGFRKRGAPTPSTPYTSSHASHAYTNQYQSSSYHSSFSSAYSSYATSSPSRALHFHTLDAHSLPRLLVLQLKRFAVHSDGIPGSSRVHATKIERHVKFSDVLTIPQRMLASAASSGGVSSMKASAFQSAFSSRTTPTTPWPASAGPTYDLVGIVVHHGHRLEGGHYTAYIKEAMEDHAKHGKETKSNGERNLSEDEGDGDDQHNPAPSKATHRWLHCDDTRITPVAPHTVFHSQAYLLFYTLRRPNRR